MQVLAVNSSIPAPVIVSISKQKHLRVDLMVIFFFQQLTVIGHCGIKLGWWGERGVGIWATECHTDLLGFSTYVTEFILYAVVRSNRQRCAPDDL